jgi:hypothetical protein
MNPAPPVTKINIFNRLQFFLQLSARSRFADEAFYRRGKKRHDGVFFNRRTERSFWLKSA